MRSVASKVMGMRRITALLAVAGAMLVLYAGGVLAQEAPGGGGGADRYIVVFDEEEVRDPTAVAREHAQRHGAEVLFT